MTSVKTLANQFFPGLYTRIYHEKQIRRLSNIAVKLRERVLDCESLSDLVERPELMRTGSFWANQKHIEIVRLLEMLKEIQPRYLCEIGAFKGGTLFLFCQVATSNAQIVSIDIDYPEKKRRPFRQFAQRGQRVHCLEADSQNTETVEIVRKYLSGHLFDFLFIDGDHSYQGVKADFELYSPLVRYGGLIAFHDIVPDHNRRFGVQTSNHTGEVPVFWNEIKQRFNHWELIEDPEQDGYGIGVLKWQG